jgi:hypothetical protein
MQQQDEEDLELSPEALAALAEFAVQVCVCVCVIDPIGVHMCPICRGDSFVCMPRGRVSASSSLPEPILVLHYSQNV